MFDTTIEKHRGISVLHFIGRLDTLASNDFGKQLSNLATSEQVLIIEASSCTYLSSTGIRAVLSAYKQMKAKGGKLMLCALRPEVFQVIEMVGLHNVLPIYDSANEAINSIAAEAEKPILNLGDNIMPFQYRQICAEFSDAIVYRNELASFGELGLSFGLGTLCEAGGNVTRGLFFTLGNCIGFFPKNTPESADFRIVSDQSMLASNVSFGLSFGKCISGKLTAQKSSIVAFSEYVSVTDDLLPKLNVNPCLMGLLIYSMVEGNPAASFVVKTEGINDIEGAGGWSELIDDKGEVAFPEKWTGVSFILAEGHQPENDDNIFEKFSRMMLIENVIEVKPFDTQRALIDPSVFLLACSNLIDASKVRLQIEIEKKIAITDTDRFLIRSLYADSSKVLLTPLHGGFSAQTFLVTSFDHQGRQLRPTVFKTAPKAMIKREAESCKNYAMPYILNNSAMVLGEVFHADRGAMLYNFVGIGGNNDRLRWLTDFYTAWDYERLIPVLDKIFLNILQPWYGQPVKANILPFADHDPTKTFFPHIYDMAQKEIGISANDKYVMVEEIGEKMLNPYWFLKYVYPTQSKFEISFLTSICHGDLNMQNILIDDVMNVFLIDFSETRPRSVISDFARLEAIYMIDNAPVDPITNFVRHINWMREFYSSENFYDESILIGLVLFYHLEKNIALSLQMRKYARMSAEGYDPILPYYMALLEWVLPVVCYRETYERKRLSMMVASIIIGEVMKLTGIEV